MWQFKDKKDLLAVAFIDAETYIHTAQSVKGFILTGDISRSIQLLHYNEGRRSLSLISQVLAMIYRFNEPVYWFTLGSKPDGGFLDSFYD